MSWPCCGAQSKVVQILNQYLLVSALAGTKRCSTPLQRMRTALRWQPCSLRCCACRHKGRLLLAPAGNVYSPASHLHPIRMHPCRHEEALQAFAEDVYYCSLEHGPEEVRTSLGYYNLAKVFQGAGSMDRALACTDQV